MIILSILFLCLLLFCPGIALAGSKYGATLWLTQLLPTLLPFFIAIRLFDSCLPQVSSRRIFLLTGILCGYPAGATLVMNQYDKGLISRRQAYFYLGFVNNPSPMFVLVFCGTTILGAGSREALILFGVLILVSLSGSLLFSVSTHILPRPLRQYLSFRKPCPATVDMTESSDFQESFSNRLDHIILDSFILLVKIGGYVIIFSILGQFMSQFPGTSSASRILCSGVLEITSGVSYLQTAPLSLHAKKALMLAILSFGGLSAAAQTNSILARSELSIFPYLIIKAGNGILAWWLMQHFLNLFHIF
jgi:hypothetical protein